MVLGAEAVRFAAEKRRSGQMDRQGPRPQPILLSGSRELDRPQGFVGRGEELTRLFGEWMERGAGQPMALLQGLAGLGKTSLAAEMIHLGFEQFDYVLAFQAKGTPLGIEELYRQDRSAVGPGEPGVPRRGARRTSGRRSSSTPERWVQGARSGTRQLAYNLVDAMSAERILLVIDNFETNLVPGKHGYACADPAWERLLAILADRLGETGSRVMVTSRHKPAVLEEKALWIPLGALPIEEAKLYFQNHAVLRASGTATTTTSPTGAADPRREPRTPADPRAHRGPGEDGITTRRSTPSRRKGTARSRRRWTGSRARASARFPTSSRR